MKFRCSPITKINFCMDSLGIIARNYKKVPWKIKNMDFDKKTDTNKIFLPHLSEPFRRGIAVRYAQQEFRKLLPQLRDGALWQSIDEQIGKWYEELSIRNFWNAIHGISMGFRLKSLIPWITSLHIKWAEKEVPVEELWFGGKFGPIASLGGSESAAEIKEKLFLLENKKLLEQIRQKLEEEAVKTAPRDNFPIFVVRKSHGDSSEKRLRVIDGNRRLLQAIVDKKDAIRAVVGEPVAEPVLYEHWVPTSLLVDLVFWYKRQVRAGRETTEVVARVIAELIRDSSAGRVEFAERSIHRDKKLDVQLLEAVVKILGDWGISLEITK